jgi:hypothetical protein
MTNITPTAEQLACISMVKENAYTKINAGAGAAKTTTLSLIANENCTPSLYLAYNKAMAVEAGNRFPGWVDVKTTHALAYSVFGRSIAHKLNRPKGPYVNVCGTGSEIARYFKIKAFDAETRKITSAGIGLGIKETVNAFEYSADVVVKKSHVSFSPFNGAKISTSVRVEYTALILKHAAMLWSLRSNIKSNILATHDTYLKLYQLSEPTFDQWDIIYLDEAQDTNECVLSILENVKGKKKVVVGDKFQQIYQWRGSVNAMDKLDYAQSTLTQSFRFGPEIADLANLVIGEGTILRGWDKLTTTTMPYYAFEYDRCYTALYRSNAALLTDAVEQIKLGKKINLEIDVRDFLKMLDSAVELKNNNIAKVKHEKLAMFESWYDLEEEVKIAGGELSRIYNMVESNEVYNVIGVLANHQNSDKPDAIYTTAHKSKGREWDVVLLAHDFPSNYNKVGEWVGLTEMERNLLYVALTRAKKELIYNDSIIEFKEREQAEAKAQVGIQGAKLEVNVKSIAAYRPDFHKTADLECLLEMGTVLTTDTERMCMTDLDCCDMDGNEIILDANWDYSGM